jgi:glycosyltransferase involved in cell wall biosynthesis
MGGPADFVEDGVNGFLVEVEDAARLAERLLAILGLGEAQWRRLSDAALATARRYTWDDAIARLERALEEIRAHG